MANAYIVADLYSTESGDIDPLVEGHSIPKADSVRIPEGDPLVEPHLSHIFHKGLGKPVAQEITQR